jgi:3-isopropylmalate dehydrogenase
VGSPSSRRRVTRARIAVLPGDGIGPEVIAAALQTLPNDLEIVEVEAGAERYLATGEVLSSDDLAVIRDSDALLFGAVGDPRVDDGILERGILLRLRKELDLYVNLRPFPEIDVVIVRENTEGLYAGIGNSYGDVAVETSINTAHAVERCARYAFDLAMSRSRRLTLAHKTNVLVHAGSLWREITERVAVDYPDVTLTYTHADAAAYHLVVDPDRLDVVLTDNLFGDLLSDVAAGLAGGLGRAASANLHPDPATRPTRCAGLFEPVHGSAPDIVGTGTADTTAATRAARMMMDELERAGAAHV